MLLLPYICVFQLSGIIVADTNKHVCKRVGVLSGVISFFHCVITICNTSILYPQIDDEDVHYPEMAANLYTSDTDSPCNNPIAQDIQRNSAEQPCTITATANLKSTTTIFGSESET